MRATRSRTGRTTYQPRPAQHRRAGLGHVRVSIRRIAREAPARGKRGREALVALAIADDLVVEVPLDRQPGDQVGMGHPFVNRRHQGPILGRLHGPDVAHLVGEDALELRPRKLVEHDEMQGARRIRRGLPRPSVVVLIDAEDPAVTHYVVHDRGGIRRSAEMSTPRAPHTKPEGDEVARDGAPTEHRAAGGEPALEPAARGLGGDQGRGEPRGEGRQDRAPVRRGTRSDERLQMARRPPRAPLGPRGETAERGQLRGLHTHSTGMAAIAPRRVPSRLSRLNRSACSFRWWLATAGRAPPASGRG